MRSSRCFGVAAAFVIGILALAPAPAAARDFYVDPENGSASGDGSAGDPWRTLEQVVEDGLIETRHWDTLPYEEGASLEAVHAGAPVQAGDTLWLRSGHHGDVVIEGAYNEAPITLAAEPGHTPTLRRLVLRAASHWVVRGLSVSPSHAPEYDVITMVDIDDHGHHGPSHDITVEGCELFSVPDVAGWAADDWVERACNGFQVDGDHVTLRDNRIRNVRFGISVGGEDARVIGNHVVNFSGDGIRGLGDRGLFERNVIKNAYDVDENHDDGFQSWSTGPDGVGSGEVRGIVLRGNLILNHEDPDQPLKATLQGIGCFDGFFTDWVIENNVVITDHWHGITLLGARGARIVNNTVIDRNDTDPGPPWIRVAPHKDGRPSEDVVVRNNLTTDLDLEGDGITEDHNLLVEALEDHFVDPAGFDLHLLETSEAVDTGSADLAPEVDRDGVPRPQGAGVDVGAYEWHDGELPLGDAGPGAGGDGGAGASGGCGCTVASVPGAAWPLAWLGLGLLLWLRRR
ncbi:MAG: choice-of-anchor Q domain-containing protein [Myxococcota bacterium]